MPTLVTKDFDTLVQDQGTTLQAQVGGGLDITTGSILRALVESNAAVALWLEGLIIQVLALARAATSKDADLDTWMADFDVIRLPGVAAGGTVTFARTLTAQSASIPVGLQVETSGGTAAFLVVAPATTDSNYDAVTEDYTLAAGASSIAVPVLATALGVGGNVSAGSVTTIADAVYYVDTVINGVAFTNGAAAESDDELRTRFVAHIASLARATPSAIGHAIDSTQAGLTYSILENVTAAGVVQPGHFTVVVDDGSGSAPASVQLTTTAAIEAYRPVSSTFEVVTPALSSVVVVGNVLVDTSVETASGIETLVEVAVTAYINGLGVGETLYYSKVVQIALAASAGALNVYGVTLGGATADIVPVTSGLVRPTSVDFTATT